MSVPDDGYYIYVFIVNVTISPDIKQDYPCICQLLCKNRCTDFVLYLQRNNCIIVLRQHVFFALQVSPDQRIQPSKDDVRFIRSGTYNFVFIVLQWVSYIIHLLSFITAVRNHYKNYNYHEISQQILVE